MQGTEREGEGSVERAGASGGHRADGCRQLGAQPMAARTMDAGRRQILHRQRMALARKQGYQHVDPWE